MKIKNIIFDFGGVLIDWNPRYMYRNFFDREEEMEWFLSNICTHHWNVLQDAGRSLEEGTSILTKSFPEHKDKVRLFYQNWEEMLNGPLDTNAQLLPSLKEKYKLLGLTNWSAETFPIALKKYPFLQLFEGIIVSGEEKMIKPDPAIFNLLLLRYNIVAEESLFIDDNKENIQAADKLGFHCVHLNDDVSLIHELQKMGIV